MRDGPGKSPRHLWLKRNRSSLTAAGLPPTVIENERWWNYLILHGDDPCQSGWDPSFVTPLQAAKIHQLIARSPFREDAGEFLRVLANRAQSANEVEGDPS